MPKHKVITRTAHERRTRLLSAVKNRKERRAQRLRGGDRWRCWDFPWRRTQCTTKGDLRVWAHSTHSRRDVVLRRALSCQKRRLIGDISMLRCCGGFIAGAVVVVHVLQIHVRYWRLRNQALKHDRSTKQWLDHFSETKQCKWWIERKKKDYWVSN